MAEVLLGFSRAKKWTKVSSFATDAMISLVNP